MTCKRLILSAIVAAALLCVAVPGFATTYLGTAQSFAVLGHESVSNTGTTTIYGNLGVSPGTSITGLPPGIVTGGGIHNNDAVAISALADATTAYNTLAALPFTYDYTGQDLGGLTLTPGVYKFTSSAGLTGTLPLTLDFTSNPNADFVFQIGSTLITGSSSVVNVIGGSSTSGIYWQVGSSATLGTSTMFAGNILALDSITLTTSADILCGRAIALTGAVTMDTNKISNNNTLETFGVLDRPDFGSYGFSGGTGVPPVPEPITMSLVGMGIVGLGGYIRRRMKVAK